MTALSQWLEGLSTLQLVLFVIGVIFGLSLAAAIVGAILVRVGMKRPKVVARASILAERVLFLVKRPLTIVVLDEVAAVLARGHYTKNISTALKENHDSLKALVAEKVKEDPSVRFIGRLPGYDAVVSEVTETTMRVLMEMLEDPRTDVLINDLLHENLEQIKQAVREHDRVPAAEPPAGVRPAP